MNDTYRNFSELARIRKVDVHYGIVVRRIPNARVAVITPHGGCIEICTSDIVRAIASDNHSMYMFEGRLPANNHELHITSHHFDEPQCLELLRHHPVVLAIHGCVGKEREIYVGGRDDAGRQHVADHLRASGFDPVLDNHDFPGTEQNNICNRGSRGMGIQLELSRPLRDCLDIGQFAEVIRCALATLPLH